MNSSLEWILNGMSRATIGLSISAILVFTLIFIIKIRSPRAEQALWSLVLIQGILWVPLTFSVPSDWIPSFTKQNSETTNQPDDNSPAIAVHNSLNESLTNRKLETEKVNGLQSRTHLNRNSEQVQTAASGFSSFFIHLETSWPVLLVATWFSGIIFLFSLGWLRYRHFLKQSEASWETMPEWDSEWNNLLSENQISTPLPMVVTRNSGPALCKTPQGYKIFVPFSLWNELESDQRISILKHELAHYLRGDIWRALIARMIAVIHWFNPLAWLAVNKYEAQLEYACDQDAAGEQTETLASALIKLGAPAKHWQPAIAQSAGNHSLFTRVQRLLNGKPDSAKWKTVLAIFIAMIAIIPTAIRVEAIAIADEKESTSKKNISAKEEATDKNKKLPEPITYTGKVVEFTTGKPIPGATVEVTHQLSRDPKTNQWITLQTTEHQSNEKGEYSFTLPPEEVAERSLYIEVDAHHPDYQSKGSSGYAHSMILKNIEQGDPPFFETVKLVAGKPITGTVLQPDGTPAKNIRVLTYSKIPLKSRQLSLEGGAFQEGRTDDQGKFRFVVATPGDGVLWIFPKNYSPIAYRIGSKRGDLGTFQLKDGVRISGRVVDANGKPVPDVAVNISQQHSWIKEGKNQLPEEYENSPEEYLDKASVSNSIGTGAQTDQNGNFELNPLPTGTYRLEVKEYVSDPTKKWVRTEKLKVEPVFLPKEIIIREGESIEPIEIQAVPHVIVRGRFFDSKGQPRASHQQHLFGKVNGQFMFVYSTLPLKDGWFEFKIPKGMEDVQIDLMTNEHSALRWRLKPGEPLNYGKRFNLGKLDKDFTTLEVVRYNAPLLLLKAVDEKGNQISDFKPNTTNKKPTAEPNQLKYAGSSVGDVSFEKQKDGRWRSSQLLPDAEIPINLDKEGYTTEEQTVSLKEGEIRELVFVLKKSKE